MSDKNVNILPLALLRYLADSLFEVIRWDAKRNELVTKVIKEIGPETGYASFYGVSYVNLQPSVTVAGLRLGCADDLPPNYFETYRPQDKKLDEDEHVFVIDGAWGERFFIVADSVSYEPEGESGPVSGR